MERELLRNNFFIKTIVGKYVASSVLSMLSASMGGMIDTVLVGRFLGEAGLSAMSLVSPVYLFYYTIGAVIGIGGSIAANLFIGRDDYDGYRWVFTTSFWVTALVCLLTTILALVFLNPLLSLLVRGGGEEAYVRDYLFWYVIGGPGTLFIYLPLNFLKCEGRPRTSSLLFLFSAGCNILLTWLFLSPVCSMGMKGASIATGISMSATAAAGLYLLIRRTPHTRLVKIQFEAKMLWEIIACGSPNGCNNLLNACKILLINGMLVRIGAAAYLPVFSLVKNVSDLATGILTGVASALMPIVGVFLGEKDGGSIRRACQRAWRIGFVLTLLLTAFTALFPEMFCNLFHITEQSVRRECRSALRFLAVSFLPAFPNLMLSGYFNAIKKPVLSNLILFLRLICYLAPAVVLLGSLAGSEGIWMGFTAAEATTLATITAVIILLRRRNPELDWYLLDTSQDGREEISFSVRNSLDDVMFASNKITDFCEAFGIKPKKTMQISLAIEEMLTVIITYCMDCQKEQFIDIRIKKLGEDVLLRIRNSGKIFDPVRYYEENQENEALAEQILGIKMIIGTAQKIEFQETFGTNNLLIQF